MYWDLKEDHKGRGNRKEGQKGRINWAKIGHTRGEKIAKIEELFSKLASNTLKMVFKRVQKVKKDALGARTGLKGAEWVQKWGRMSEKGG